MVESQRGVSFVKRDQLAYRLHLEVKSGREHLMKRVSPYKSMNIITRKEMVVKDQIREMSSKKNG